MSIQKTRAVVLRRQDLRETSLIVNFYTEGFGKIKGVLRGVRGPRAQSGGAAAEIFVLDEIVFYERKRSEYYTVSQCDLIEFFEPIRQSLERLAYATYMIEMLDSLTPLSEKNEQIFGLLLNSLTLLKGESSPRRVARIFEIKLLDELGMMPALAACVSCAGAVDASARFSFRHGGLMCKNCMRDDRDARPILAGTVKFIEHIRALPFEKVARVKVEATVGKELEQVLRKFLDYHIERRLNSLAFIKEIEKA